ncbi:MAG TPA: hypothetical protein DFR83_03420, partial [Deltaproteobacteria bacterium]|nr:hypothetical protein [Deltaproteobacteria bacterium]
AYFGRGSSSSTGNGNGYLLMGPMTASCSVFEYCYSSVVTFYPDGSGDRLGQGIAAGEDLTGDGNADVIFGARYNDDAYNNAGSAYIWTGPFTTGSSNYAANADVQLTGTANDDFAFGGLAMVGDVNGDGNADLLVGAAHAEQSGYPTDAGEAYLIYGPISSDLSLSAADVTWQGEADYDYLGGAVDTVGDLDGDGYADLAVGAAKQDDGGTDAGALYLMYGPASGGGGVSSAADAMITGAAAGDGLSPAIASLGDMDGDGADDFAVSAPKTGNGGTVYLFYGALSTTVSASTANVTLEQSVGGNGAGYSIAAAGDVDGDGNLDIAVNDSGADNLGKLYVYLGPLSGTLDLEEAPIIFTGSIGEGFGWSVTGMGDADGDGQDDLFVSSQSKSSASSSAGTMYVLTGMSQGL